MAQLTFSDRMQFEKLLAMSSGYVLDFSNRTFQDFVRDSVKIDIYDQRFVFGHSGSKANCLRSFWKVEPSHIVGKLLADLVNYFRQKSQESDLTPTADECAEIAKRLTEDMSMGAHQPLIFISYAGPDARIIRGLDSLLQHAGLRTWFDKKDLKGGEDWEYIIRQRIGEAAIVLICLSTRAVDRKGFFHKEMRFAASEAGKLPKGRVYIIPIRFDQCEIPDDLRQWHVLDLFDSSGSYGLLSSIEAVLNNDIRARTEAHQAFARVVSGCHPFVLNEGEAFKLPTRLLGEDRCMYDVDVSGLIVGDRSAKLFLSVQKHVVGRPVEIVHNGSHGLESGESVEIAAPWRLSLERVDNKTAYFVIQRE